MFPVYSVTHVPGLYPALRSLLLLDVPYSTPAVPFGRAPGQDGIFDASLQKPIHNPGSLESDN